MPIDIQQHNNFLNSIPEGLTDVQEEWQSEIIRQLQNNPTYAGQNACIKIRCLEKKHADRNFGICALYEIEYINPTGRRIDDSIGLRASFFIPQQNPNVVYLTNRQLLDRDENGRIG